LSVFFGPVHATILNVMPLRKPAMTGALVICVGCRFFAPNSPLDRKTAAGLLHDVTVVSPWIRIPAGLPPAPLRNAKALRAFRQLSAAGYIRCDADFAQCGVGPKGQDFKLDGGGGFRVTVGMLMADQVTVLRRIDLNTTSGTVTVRFHPTPVFKDFRPDLVAMMNSQGSSLEPDVIASGSLANVNFHRENGKWHLEQIDALGNTGRAFRRGTPTEPDAASLRATNVAQSATVLVSSEDVSSGHAGVNAIDGLVDGSSQDSTSEWATTAEREGAWIKLTWSAPVHVWEVILHGRANPNEGVRRGTLTFSDGSSIGVSELRRDASGMRIPFVPRSITWLQFQVTSVAGPRTGLAEIEVLGSPTQ